MPVIETSKTAKGCSGKSSVPAITSGVEGSSVIPRTTENARYISQITPLKRRRNSAIFSAVNFDGSARYVPKHAKTIAAQRTRTNVLTILVVFEIRVFNESYVLTAHGL